MSKKRILKISYKMANKKLVRSNNKVIAGVCAGIAEYFDVDSTMIRICYAALTIFSAGFPGVLLYIIMLILMPPTDGKNNIEDAEIVK